MFDKIRNKILRFEKTSCPNCGNMGFHADDSERFPSLECEICHFRITFSTRNNNRLTSVVSLGILLFILGTLVGIYC